MITTIPDYILTQYETIRPLLQEVYACIRAAIPEAEELKGYKTSKGTVQIPVDRPLPLGLIADLARWSYEHNRK